MQVGSVVIIGRGSAINRPGEIGVCYEQYTNGFSFIFENGGYDGFSIEDLGIFEVRELTFCVPLMAYIFKNVIKLSEDHRRGVFNMAFALGTSALQNKKAAESV